MRVLRCRGYLPSLPGGCGRAFLGAIRAERLNRNVQELFIRNEHLNTANTTDQSET